MGGRGCDKFVMLGGFLLIQGCMVVQEVDIEDAGPREYRNYVLNFYEV